MMDYGSIVGIVPSIGRKGSQSESKEVNKCQELDWARAFPTEQPTKRSGSLLPRRSFFLPAALFELLCPSHVFFQLSFYRFNVSSTFFCPQNLPRIDSRDS